MQNKGYLAGSIFLMSLFTVPIAQAHSVASESANLLAKTMGRWDDAASHFEDYRIRCSVGIIYWRRLPSGFGQRFKTVV